MAKTSIDCTAHIGNVKPTVCQLISKSWWIKMDLDGGGDLSLLGSDKNLVELADAIYMAICPTKPEATPADAAAQAAAGHYANARKYREEYDAISDDYKRICRELKEEKKKNADLLVKLTDAELLAAGINVNA